MEAEVEKAAAPAPARQTLADKIPEIFRYHPPEPGQNERYEEIRDAAKMLAYVIVKNTPTCADQSAAIRHVREAVMTANAAIALKGIV